MNWLQNTNNIQESSSLLLHTLPTPVSFPWTFCIWLDSILFIHHTKRLTFTINIQYNNYQSSHIVLINWYWKWYSSRVSYPLWTVSDEQFKEVVKISNEHNVKIHVHLHETKYEIESSVNELKMRPFDRLEALGNYSVFCMNEELLSYIISNSLISFFFRTN